MSETSPLTILGVCGSLRRESWNKKLLNACVGLVPEGVTLSIHPIDEVPLFNGDVYDQGFPEPVQRLRAAIAAADALLFVTPEYNYSIPGVLKNAMDWVSRPPSQPFAGKPAATLGASPGLHGTVRGQTHTREVCMGLGMIVSPKPEVYVGRAPEKFNAAGELTDADTAKFVREALANLATLARKLRA